MCFSGWERGLGHVKVKISLVFVGIQIFLQPCVGGWHIFLHVSDFQGGGGAETHFHKQAKKKGW